MLNEQALELAIQEYLQGGQSLEKIGLKYGIERHTISKYLKKQNIDVKHQFDINYFDKIDTEEKAYWLGFWYADGYLAPVKNKMELSLKADDIEHVKKFSKCIKHRNPNCVKIGHVWCSYNGQKIKCQRCRLSLQSEKLWNDLVNYGCTPNKSLTITFPKDKIPQELIMHFIRGYFDGDGCVSFCNKEHTQLTVSLMGTEQFLKDILDITNTKATITHPSGAYQFMISHRIAFNFIDQLYKDATIYLDRKYERYLTFKQKYNK